MPRLTVALVFALALAGCGGEEEPRVDEGPAPAPTSAPADDAAGSPRRPPGEEGLRVAAEQARIVAQDSDFGRVLFDANGQVVYVFELDGPDQSSCTSAECVKAWPPVLTEQEPTAGPGVEAALLGTIEREDGGLQVTYAGRPLYFYEHEAPGEIRCHDVNLHGGLWWVLTPEGEPAA